MELWIRSQDKELLVKVKDIELGDFDEEKCLVANNLQNIGKYKTKERALEVLDEINDILQLKFCTTLGTFEEVFKGYTEKQLKFALKQMAVYQMPKE